MIMSNVPLGISTSLYADKFAVFLQNSIFTNVATLVMNSDTNAVLLLGSPDGSSETLTVDSWGFGQVTNAAGEAGFVNG
jgi:hypothetical protein